MTAPRRTTRGRARPPAVRQMPRMPPVLLSRGVCASHPRPDLWLSGALAESEAARHLCGTCPVRAPCLAWALALPPGSDLATTLGGLDAERPQPPAQSPPARPALGDQRGLSCPQGPVVSLPTACRTRAGRSPAGI